MPSIGFPPKARVEGRHKGRDGRNTGFAPTEGSFQCFNPKGDTACVRLREDLVINVGKDGVERFDARQVALVDLARL